MSSNADFMENVFLNRYRNILFSGLLGYGILLSSANALEKKINEIENIFSYEAEEVKEKKNLPEIDYKKDGVIDSLDLFVGQDGWYESTGSTMTKPNELFEIKKNWHETYDARILPESFTVDISNFPEEDYPIRMIKVNKGSFLMGSSEEERGRVNDESPQHEVNIDYNFFMQETEVTQAQWYSVIGKWPNRSQPIEEFGVGDNHPIYFISWNEANDFVNKLNEVTENNNLLGGRFRLPSEAEWEYVCRAGTNMRFFFGDSLNCNDECEDCEAGDLPRNRSDYVWYCANNLEGKSNEVAKLKPNQWGFYDMPGNVFEWCEDYFHFSYNGAPSDGSAWLENNLPIELRVSRGSSYDSISNQIKASRSAARGATNGTFEFNGLRLVYDPR